MRRHGFVRSRRKLPRAPWFYIPAIMVFPENSRRRRILDTEKAHALKDVLTKMSDDEDALPWLRTCRMARRVRGALGTLSAEAVASARHVKGNEIGHRGPLAGLTLLIPLIMSQKDPTKRPGRGAAYRSRPIGERANPPSKINEISECRAYMGRFGFVGWVPV